MSASGPGRRAPRRRRLLVPEVVQTSGMDCGPAALKALLEGFHIPISYGRLREACHTDVDGTSIDTLEDLARQLGLVADQIVLPSDHLLLSEADALPAIVVTRTPAGAAHFAVLWRIHGPLVQVMDPARGRLWLPRRAFLNSLFSHGASVPATAWRDWARSEAFLAPLRRRITRLGLSRARADAQISEASADPTWRGLAALDAALRMASALRESGAIGRGLAAATLAPLAEAAREEPAAIPEQYWSVTDVPGTPELVRFRGAVLVRVRGLHREPAAAETAPEGRRSAELVAALSEPPARPLRHVLGALRADGPLLPIVAGSALAIAAAGVILEAVLLRSVLDLATILKRPEQGLAASLLLVLFGLAMLALEFVLASAERRAGSHLEARLRVGFLAKIPRLIDSYFQSRPISDMLERSHMLHVLRTLPQLGVRFLRIAAELLLTTAAVVWLDPRLALLAVAGCVAAAVVPLLGNLVMSERDLKVRTHAGALTRFHLDALLGRTAIEAHGAESTIEREHDRLLAEWAHASLALQRSSAAIEGVQMLVGFGLAAWILFGHLTSSAAGGTMLLMTYWVLNMPALGYELALTMREYPAHRSTLLRLLEPMGAPDALSERLADDGGKEAVPSAPTVRIEAHGLSVRVAGQPILDQIDLQIPAGSHVAIVGASGSGKSTLIGLLLGWHRPSSGALQIDGAEWSQDRIEALRADTAWVDPTVQLWNRSLAENLAYGSTDPLGSMESMGSILEASGLMPVIGKLPDGLATRLGEGGALLSAGEGQRVRLGRAMARGAARLVLLDEPFLGLERDRRRALLSHARHRWQGTTLLYVTHDVTETRSFDWILVMDRGRIVEEGAPHHLSQMASSRYRRLIQAQEAAYARLTSSGEWRRIRLENGKIVQDHAAISIEQRA